MDINLTCQMECFKILWIYLIYRVKSPYEAFGNGRQNLEGDSVTFERINRVCYD